MPDDTKAACRAALLRACRVTIDRGVRGVAGGDAHLGFGECVQVDDAAACMAEREAKLRDKNLLQAILAAPDRELSAVFGAFIGVAFSEGYDTTDEAVEAGLVRVRELATAALAAAQDKP